jgi:Holliday junction DNA helicase RuvA
MIEFIEGIIDYGKEGEFIILNCDGIGYGIKIHKGFDVRYHAKVKVDVRQIVREDSLTLYGFNSIIEKLMFDQLLKVPKVGPAVAMRIVGAIEPSDFQTYLNEKNSAPFESVPGIGKKSAQAIIKTLSK